MFVKICGTTNLADARLAIGLGADALGFIFAPSKRHVTAEGVAEITPNLPPHVARVGVFNQPDVQEIARTVRTAGLTAVQMHWPFNEQTTEALHRELGDDISLWQVVGVEVQPRDLEASNQRFTAELTGALLDKHLHYLLLDAIMGGASGGLGQRFPWEQASRVVQHALLTAAQTAGGDGSAPPNILLAGGLDANNVREAIAALQPWGVDVVSGVEARPGKKSPDRLAAFFSAVRQVS